MTYVFPKALAPLREFLRGQGADVKSFVSARQAAFMAQQLIGSRVKFPPQGQDMTATLLQIQQAVPKDAKPIMKPSKKPTKAKVARIDKHRHDFAPDMFASGFHVFCDGAAVPNPGAGGWGVVAYQDGQEIGGWSGGDPETTNNAMELTGMLVAIEKAAAWSSRDGQPVVTIWCDSQYVVNGCNDWLAKRKANGWNRRPLNSPKRAEGEIKNLDLWKAIDAALHEDPALRLEIKWCKGHVGIAGNERADELAEEGRQAACEVSAGDDLDERYRLIMGAA